MVKITFHFGQTGNSDARQSNQTVRERQALDAAVRLIVHFGCNQATVADAPGRGGQPRVPIIFGAVRSVVAPRVLGYALWLTLRQMPFGAACLVPAPSPLLDSPRLHHDDVSYGALRADLNVKIVADIMSMRSYGPKTMEQIMPMQNMPPKEDIIAGLGAVLDCALTPVTGSDSEVGKAAAREVLQTPRQRFEQIKQDDHADG